MTKTRMLGAILLVCLMAAGSAYSTDVYLGISGPGAVNDSTIKAGEKVTMEVHWSNDINDLRGFTTGFKIVSSDVKKVKHVSDSGKGLNDNGDIKGHNGWENTQVWDFSGVWAVPVDWDGALPELVGFGGLVIKNKYQAHDMMKVLSWDVVFDEAGTIVVDSAFFPPGGIWTVVDPKKGEIPPKWHGPYKFTIVK